MARNVKNRVQVFNLLESEGVQENERILKNGPEKDSEPEQTPTASAAQSVQSVQPEVSQPTPTEEKEHELEQGVQQKAERSTRKSLFGSTPLKSEKGVKVMLPMDYYFKLVRLKECSGKTLQELAAQGVMEFIDKYSR